MIPAGSRRSCALDMALVKAEFPPPDDGSLYLNTGSCGRKSHRVLTAIAESWQRFNNNPTYWTFYNEEHLTEARRVAAEVIGGSPDNLLLTQNSTQGLQLVMQTFLLNPGDEFVTTTHEHGSVRTIARYLEETRGIVVRHHKFEPHAGSDALCAGILKLISPKTRLVEVSEVDSFTGWRPNLKPLSQRLKALGVPLLVDGAHAPGQARLSVSDYPIWVGSGHKWLGAPNGVGFLHIKPLYAEQLKPSWLGDRYYGEFDNPLMRFEFQGTADVGRFTGLTAACKLALDLGLEAIADRQNQLLQYARTKLAAFSSTVIRTPDVTGETTGILTVTFNADHIKVKDLKEWLWEQHRIWVQPDFYFGDPGYGMRLSLHYSLNESDIDKLVAALSQVIA
ncbi:MAG TPA: aminotransferase class V-fold PLP-dependent enzyme [Candidatus Obscuribacterales bacterium]